MALSAPTFKTPNTRENLGDRVVVIVDYTLDDSYQAGGYAVTPASLAMSEFSFVTVVISSDIGTTTYVPQFNHVDNTIQLFQQTDPADTGGADVPLVEVADNTDVSTVKVRVLAIGL